MRSTKARGLNGGVTSENTASARKLPKRPSDSTTARTRSPSQSNGRSGTGSGRSAIEASAIDPQRPQREILRVQMVLEHEDAREAGAIPVLVVPGAVFALGRDQMLDPALHDRSPSSARGQQAQQRPRRLRRGGGTAAGQLRPVVALAGLAPAAIAVLGALQPPHCALDILVLEVLADGLQAPHHRPGAVDIVDAPASEPRTVMTLSPSHEVDRPLGRFEVRAMPARTQQLETPASQVLGGWVQER